MKKVIVIIMAAIFMLSSSACGNTVKGEEGVIERARQELPLADAEDIEIKILGSHFLGDKHVFWLMTGNEYQANSYFAAETNVKGENEYEFVKLYEPMDRGMDIRVLYYTCMGENVLDTYYLFMINNEKCTKLLINGEEEINIDSIPFVYKYKDFEGEYVFLDKDGSEIY